MRQLDISNWSDYILDRAVNYAYELTQKYPDAHLVSVGQSPSWIIYAAAQIRKARGEDEQVSFLPFSGRFMTRAVSDDYPAYMLSDNRPTADNLSHYFNFMSEKGVCPPSIAARFNEAGRQTVFIDYSCTGQGLASFLHLCLEAQRRVDNQDVQRTARKATLFHALTNEGAQLHNEPRILVQSAQKRFVGVDLQSLHIDAGSYFVNLAGFRGEEGGHLGSDRLVPSYDISKTGKNVLLPTENDARIKLVKRKFDDKVSSFLDKQRRKALKAAAPSPAAGIR
jgi:hypothetical protein